MLLLEHSKTILEKPQRFSLISFKTLFQSLREGLKKKNIESLTAVKPERGGGGFSGLVVIVLRFFFAMLQTYLCGLRKPQNTFCGHSKLHIAYLYQVI